MTQISVNLLPQEVILQRSQSSKLSKVTKLSFGLLVVLIFFTSATLALRVSQMYQLNQTQQGLARAQERLAGFQNKEGQMVVLKQRLDAIQSLIGTDEGKKSIFNLIVYLTPSDMQISDLTVDRNSNLMVSFSSPSLVAVETLISSLGDTGKNFDLISKVHLEGLSYGKDSVYRFTLKITSKS